MSQESLPYPRAAPSPKLRDDGGMSTRAVYHSILPVAILAVLGLIVAGCGDPGSPPTAESSSALTTVAPITPPATSIVDTTGPESSVAATTTEPPPTDPPTTEPAPPPEWEQVADMPSLAYLPCCASNYVGDPSPELPADPVTPLAPGVYHASRQQPGEGEQLDPASISFTLRPFVPCGTPEVFCEEGFVDGEVGVGPTSREITMPLDDEVTVVVGGFRCLDSDTPYETDHQRGTGSLLATLQLEMDTAYAETVAPLVLADTPFDQYEIIFAEPVNGFRAACAFAGVLQFQGGAGPAILLQTLGTYDPDVEAVVPSKSIAVETIRLTALEVADDGSQTLYFYAGFLS
jgi:hypothetical protein